MTKIAAFCCILGALIPLAGAAEFPLERIRMPEGFSIGIYAEDVDNARQMALGENGTVFVGSMKAGQVHALVDVDGDNRADRVILLADGLDMPSGVEFRAGSLYVGSLDRVLRYDDIENRLDDPPTAVVVSSTLPDKRHHGWKYLRFAPDGSLFLNVGAPCNICDDDGMATIRRMNVATGSHEIYARGVRNSVGLAFHPDSGELWFTDNGRDMMGDDMPSCELNHAPEAGMHFGFPFCHQGDTPDPEYGQGRDCSEFTAPAAKLGAHVAPLGLTFYTGKQFAQTNSQHLFIAEHGSWNRSKKVGYRIIRVDTSLNPVKAEVFIDGWLTGESAWGRPVDIITDRDGSLLVSDDKAGVIYRISYK